MKLRTKLLTLSLLTLLLPWSGWKLLQELERFLREAQEGALLASARTLAGAMPVGFQTRLLYSPSLYVPLRDLGRRPDLDGYTDDWPHAGEGLEFSSDDGELTVSLLAGSHQDHLYLVFDVSDTSIRHASPEMNGAPEYADRIEVMTRNPRGLFSFTIDPEAPGPLQLHSEQAELGQVAGYWLDHTAGYRVELALPSAASNTDLSFRVHDARLAQEEPYPRVAGPLANPELPQWISLAAEWSELSGWFARSEVAFARTWLVDPQGWVLADSGPDQETDSGPDSGLEQQTTWLQRLLYRLVAGSRTTLLDERPIDPVRLSDDVVAQAISGRQAVSWTQDLDTAVVWNTVAVPVVLEDEIRGAIVMQSSSDGLLLMTNRALARLLFTTLALTIGLAAGLWYFATRLSRRVQRLSSAVSEAMENGVDPDALPLVQDRDELGALARNNQKLLQAVADYSQYLQTLAGKLSHELKTPLAITRSSLDNLSGRDLDSETRRFLDRAQEGVDRQAEIVRAMSEANRLEASIGIAEWAEIDLAKLVQRCAEGYRSVHTGRRLTTRLPDKPATLTCAPDLLAQALDKLVDNAMSMSTADDEVTLILRSSGEQYDLAVRNAGSSLPEELQERLFDSLVSLRDRRGGEPHLGLGLYIVRLVAAAHNGSVKARNLPDDRGVEFLIRLPKV